MAFSILKLITFVFLPVLLLRYAPFGRYYARVALYLSCLAWLAGAVGGVLAASMAIIGKRFEVNHRMAMIFYPITSRLMDFYVEVEGQDHLDNNQPAILMINHQSMLDILVLARITLKRTSIMVKHTLQYTPLCIYLYFSGAIPINRSNSTAAVRSLTAAADTMKSKDVSVVVFPEGTRRLNPKPGLLPLKKGGFHLAVEAGVPIVPIVVENYWKLYRPGSFLKGTIKIRVLPPVPTAGLKASDVTELSNRVRTEMLTALHDISTRTLDGSASH